MNYCLGRSKTEIIKLTLCNLTDANTKYKSRVGVNELRQECGDGECNNLFQDKRGNKIHRFQKISNINSEIGIGV